MKIELYQTWVDWFPWNWKRATRSFVLCNISFLTTLRDYSPVRQTGPTRISDIRRRFHVSVVVLNFGLEIEIKGWRKY